MDKLFNNPISTNLGGAKPLAAPTSAIPGSGITSFFRNLFSAPNPAQSLTGGANAKPLVAPSLTSNAYPFPNTPLAAISKQMPTIAPPAQAPSMVASAPAAPVMPNPLAPTVAHAQTLPAPTTPQPDQQTLVALQGEINKIASGVKNLQAPSFSLGTSGDITSNHLAPSVGQQELFKMAADKRNALLTGSNPGAVPSDALMDFLKRQREAYQLPQGYTDALSTFNDSSIDALTRSFDLRRQVQKLQEDGTITKEQAKGYVDEANRRANIEFADIENRKAASSLEMDVFNRVRSANIEGINAEGSFYKPMEVAPGSSLASPLGGGLYQGAGASPATITSYATQLYTQDLNSGQVRIDPNTGQVDQNYYLQSAQQALGGISGGMGMPGVTSGPQVPGAGQYTPGTPQSLPPAFQSYVFNATDGQPYINGDRVPVNQQNMVKQAAASAGVPFLMGGDLDKYQSILVTQSNLEQLAGVTEDILGSGLTGRTIGALWNTVASKLQLDPKISSFSTWRDTAINTIQALAGGQGSGFRLNQAEIDVASSNLPTIHDNIETANAKLDIVNSLMNRWKSQILTGNPGETNTSTSGQGGPIDWNSI